MMEIDKNKPLACVILAAGEGKRMKSSLPKVAHALAGRPLLIHVLLAARSLSPQAMVTVVPPQNQVIAELANKYSCPVIQEEKLGTGDAMLQAVSQLQDFQGDILVLCGDVPLIRPETVRNLLAEHRKSSCSATVLTAEVNDPTGYGRIIRGPDGLLVRIVEEVDADIDLKQVREINSGIYCFSSPLIWNVLSDIGNDNCQGEYYLTDAVRLLVARGDSVGAFLLEDPREIQGINSRQQLAQAEDIYQQRRRRELWEKGVTLVSPQTTYIQAGATIEPDTQLGPFCFIGADARIGANCRIAPFSHIRSGQVIPAHTNFPDNLSQPGVNL